MKKLLTLIITISTILISCEKEDFNVNADYKETTVVFGLLNPNETRQYIKINKTFLGSGDAYDYAMVKDSSEYDPQRIAVTVKEINNIGQEVNVYNNIQYEEITRNPFSPGDFYEGEQIMYYFDATDLNTTNSYKIEVEKDGVEDVNAITKIASPIDYKSPNFNTTRIKLKQNGEFYDNYPLTFLTSANCTRYDVHFTFSYLEEYADGSASQLKKFNKFYGTVYDDISPSPGDEESLSINGETIYRWIGEEVPVDGNVSRRVVYGMTFIVYGAEESLDIYMKLNDPSENISQNSTTFNNVNNGLGLFSSRSSEETQLLFPENQQSTVELLNGQYTAGRGFCFDIDYVEQITESAAIASLYNDYSCY